MMSNPGCLSLEYYVTNPLTWKIILLVQLTPEPELELLDTLSYEGGQLKDMERLS